MRERRKIFKEKGRNSAKYSTRKMDFRTEMRVDLCLQDKTKSKICHKPLVLRSNISHSSNIFLALLRSVTLTPIIPPRQKT